MSFPLPLRGCLIASLLVVAGCEPNLAADTPDLGASPDLGGTQSVVECGGALPSPGAGQRCVTTAGEPGKGTLLRGTVLLADKVLHAGEVLVGADGRIACAACDCSAMAAGATVVACKDGVISPGLINTHDHITFTKAEPVTSDQYKYEHRHEWRRGVQGDPTRPRLTVAGGNNTSAVQWGELRQLMAGETSVIGSGQARGVLRNLDTTSQEGLDQPPVEFETFPLGDSGGTMISSGCNYPNIVKSTALANYDSFLPHIGEGINAAAHNEFKCTSTGDDGGQDLVTNKTSMIHAIALRPEDARLAATRHAAVIWSPRSNVSLYGDTAQVAMLDRMGVLISLGTDWTASGSINILRELRCADDLNKTQFDGHFSDADLWRMVTLNAALAAATVDAIGELRKGYVADIAIFQGSPPGGGKRDHRAVIAAGVEDVVLVMRAGLAMYGDANVLEALGADDAAKCELADVCGVPKRICAERETGKNLADLETAAIKPIYQLFACGAPPKEPSCVPSRAGRYTGVASGEDPDGDGLTGTADNCPRTFNPIRPMDQGKQPDADGDGRGDACDPCPLDKDSNMCIAPLPDDRDDDAIPDNLDNCLAAKNPDQKDADVDGVGDACDGCPTVPNTGGAACPFTVKELRDPALGKRPAAGTRVVVKDLLVLAVRSKAGYGFHARDLGAGQSQDYSGILVFVGGSAAPKAADGTPIAVGHVVSLRGRLTTFFDQDELDSVSDLTITGMAAVEPLAIQVADLLPAGAGSKVERLENLLVTLSSVTEIKRVSSTDDDFWVSEDAQATCDGGGPGCALVGDYLLDGNKADMSPPITPGRKLSTLTGIVSGFRNLYGIDVRSLADIVY